MEWSSYASGFSSGAFVVLALFVVLFLYKSRGFRIGISVTNSFGSARARVTPARDYYAEAHGEPVSSAGGDELPVLSREPRSED